MNPNRVDPFPGPKWLSPQLHPEAFPRQWMGLNFRLPGWRGWGIWAGSFVASMILGYHGWPWFIALPLGLPLVGLFWSGILTNFGKPIRSAMAILLIMLAINLLIVLLALALIVVIKVAGLDPPTREEPVTTTSVQAIQENPDLVSR